MSADLDYELACLLQAELNDEDRDEPMPTGRPHSSHSAGKPPRSGGDDKPLSIVDERWEMLDPTPDVRAMFIEFDSTFFKGRLAGVEVKWSPRMTLCAGVCSYEGRGGLCSIRLSTPLLKLRPRKDLVETLLHEMIHAYLFVTQNNRDRDGHGPEFCKHMNRINGETGTKISIYHNFRDEVDLYRQHIWRCDGPCRTRKPFFGYVKRAMNRAPSPRDTWWASHQQTCGGTYHKEKEPEGYGEKKGKRKREEENNKGSKKSKGRDVDSVPAFEGKGKMLNDSSNIKVHPTLQEIWAKKQHAPSITNKPSTTSLNGSVGSNSTSKHIGRDDTSKTEGNIHGFSGKVPPPKFSTGMYKSDSGKKGTDAMTNGTSKTQSNIYGFSGNVPPPKFSTGIYKSDSGKKGTDAMTNGTSKTQSNIYGFAGKVRPPTSGPGIYKPEATKTNKSSSQKLPGPAGRSESDSDDSKENRHNDPNVNTHGIQERFPGRGQLLGGKPKPCIDHDRAKPDIDHDRAKPDNNHGARGWLSKQSQDKEPLDKVNKDEIKIPKHIKMSRKIIKLMEIVGSDSDSDTDEEKMSTNNAIQPDRKPPTPVQYISDSDEEEKEYNARITSQMFANDSSDSDSSSLPNSRSMEGGHTLSNTSAKCPKNMVFTERKPLSTDGTNAAHSSKILDQTGIEVNNIDVVSTTDVGPKVKCPICGCSVKEASINQHLDECLNQSFLNQ